MSGNGFDSPVERSDRSTPRPSSAGNHVAFNFKAYTSRPMSAASYSELVRVGSFGSYGPAPPVQPTMMMKYSRHCPEYEPFGKPIGYNYNRNNSRVSF